MFSDDCAIWGNICEKLDNKMNWALALTFLLSSFCLNCL